MEKSEQPKVTTKSNCEVKQSESEPMVPRPSCSPFGQTPSKQTPPLSLSKFFGTTSNPGVKGNVSSEMADSYEFTFSPALKHKSIRSAEKFRPLDSTSLGQTKHLLAETQSDSGTEAPFLSDHDSLRSVNIGRRTGQVTEHLL